MIADFFFGFGFGFSKKKTALIQLAKCFFLFLKNIPYLIYVNCHLRNEYESDLRSNEHYLSSSENKAWKKLGLHEIWAHDPCVTDAVLYLLS